MIKFVNVKIIVGEENPVLFLTLSPCGGLVDD